MTDVLSDILDTVHLAGTLYFRTDFSAPWAIQVPEHKQAARFHLVVQGRCTVGFSNGQTVELQPGDMILIPKGRAHILADSAGRHAAPLEKVIQESGYQGQGVFVLGEGDPDGATQMVCGHFSFRDGADHPLLRALPDFLLTSAATRARHPLLDEMLRLIVRKSFADDYGTVSAVIRLSEIVFIELLNIEIGQSPELGRISAAIRDKQIGRALSLIHGEPGRAWSVEILASEVGMSRSRFAERFRELVDQSPMSYLSEWRLQKALALLSQSSWSVQEIANRTGYQSPAAFSRAFTEAFGAPPSRFRQSRQ